MSCVVSYTHGPRSKPVVRGPQPRGQVPWSISVWFVLDHEKHTHSAKVPPVDVLELAPVVGQLVDGLIAEHGDSVSSCGWIATSHGGTKGKKKRR